MSDKPDTPHPEEDPTLHRNPASGVPADESSKPLSQEPTRVIGDESIPLGAREISPSTRAPGDPSQVGQYRIIGRIGSGAMGVVYRAEQASPKRIVALKVLYGNIQISNKHISRIIKFQQFNFILKVLRDLKKCFHPRFGLFISISSTYFVS